MTHKHIEDILDEFIKDLKNDYELNEKKEEAINEAIGQIMHNFDFEKVHKVMECLDYKLSMENRIPTLPELRTVASELLYDAAENECSETACGFVVDINKNNFLIFDAINQKYQCNLKLSFVVESSNSCA